MDRDELRKYLDTSRLGWPYEVTYRVEALEGHRFTAESRYEETMYRVWSKPGEWSKYP